MSQATSPAKATGNTILLLIIAVPLGLLGAFAIGSCAFNAQSRAAREAAAHPPVRSSAYQTGYGVGQDLAGSGARLMEDRFLQTLSKIRFPDDRGDQLDFRQGYRTGFSEPRKVTAAVSPAQTLPSPTPSGSEETSTEDEVETRKWRDLSNRAADVAKQWEERSQNLEAWAADLRDLPLVPSMPLPVAAPRTVEYHRRWFEYYDARGKAWRARAQALETRPRRYVAQSTPTPADVPAQSASSFMPSSSAARTRTVSGYTRKDGTYVQSYRRR